MDEQEERNVWGVESLCSPTSASSSSFHALHVSFRSFYLVRTTARGCCNTVTRLRAYTNIEVEQICPLSSTHMLYLCVPQRRICSQLSFYICFKGVMQLLNVLTLTNKLVWRLNLCHSDQHQLNKPKCLSHQIKIMR